MKAHKHKEAIIAWAFGFDIEMRKPGKDWIQCTDTPQWLDEWEYRTKDFDIIIEDVT
jgi:hypothetical protein